MKSAIMVMMLTSVLSGTAEYCAAQQVREQQTPHWLSEDSALIRKWNVPGKKNHLVAFYEDRYGKPFVLKGRFRSTDGKEIDFSNLDRPVFLSLGFYGCHPCMHELPVVIESAGQYPEVDFVYITYDKADVRRKEFAAIGKKKFRPGPNYFIIEMHDEDITRYGLAMGYPTKYFIDTGGIVRYIRSGGDPTEPVADIRARIARIIGSGS